MSIDPITPIGPNSTPPTDARILANRENAKKSTGPRTAAGKVASSRNALKHGLSAQCLLSHPNQELHREILSDLYQRYQPSTVVEKLIVGRIAFDLVRLDAIAAAYMSTPEQTLAGFAVLEDFFAEGAAERRNAFLLLSRYETKIENSLQRDMRMMEDLCAARPHPGAAGEAFPATLPEPAEEPEPASQSAPEQSPPDP